MLVLVILEHLLLLRLLLMHFADKFLSSLKVLDALVGLLLFF